MPELINKRHEAFAHEYVANGFNGTDAYKKVYPKASQKVAESKSSVLVGNDKVSQRIAELNQARNERTDSKGDEFLRQLEYMAMFDPTEVLGWDGFMLNVKKFDEIPIEARRMITSVKERKEFTEDGEYIGASLDIKFASKEKIMELYGRTQGSFNDKLQVSNKTVEDYIREAKEKNHGSKRP